MEGVWSMRITQRRRGAWLMGAAVLAGALSPAMNIASRAQAGEAAEPKRWCEMEVELDFDLDEARTHCGSGGCKADGEKAKNGCNAGCETAKTACQSGQCGTTAKVQNQCSTGCGQSQCDDACENNNAFAAWAGEFLRQFQEAQEPSHEPTQDEEPSVAEFSRAVEVVLADPRPTAVIVEAEDGVFVLTRGEEVGDILVTKYSADILEDLAKRNTPPACPERLDRSQPCKTDPELAAMQRAYLHSYREGLLAEARAVSEEMARATEALAAQPTIEPRRLPVQETPTHHQVGYQQPAPAPPYPQPAGPATVFLTEGKPVSWKSVRARTASCHFQGDSLAEAARFFHQATGMTVRMEHSTRKDVQDAGVHVLCQDKSIEQCLRIVCGCCGYGYIVRGGELVLAPADDVERIAGQGGQTIDAVWKP
jgi:hypothetical protein